MSIHALALALHVGSGTIALATFWLSALLKKGSRPHVLSGRFYLLAMCCIVVSAVPLVVLRLIDGQVLAATFLGYLAVLVTSAIWLGWRAIRDKADPARYLGRMYHVLMVVNPLAGLVVLAVGLRAGHPLFIGFSLIGLLLGVDMWRRRRIIPRQPQWWLREHYSAMLGNGVATHIAFLVIGLPRLLPGIDGGALYYAAWFVPLVVSIAANIWLDRRFRFSGPSARPLATPTRA